MATVSLINDKSPYKSIHVRFKCGRCSAQEDEPLSDNIIYDTCPIYISNMKPPKGWIDQNDSLPLLCPDCAKKLFTFLYTPAGT